VSKELLEDLSRRLQRLEDELAVHRLLVDYGLAVDAGDQHGFSELLTEDAVYELDGTEIAGRDAIVSAVFAGGHRAIAGFAAHTIGPVTVEIDGERALARGYSRLYVVQDEEIVLWRLSLNSWECVRQGTKWRVARRTARLLGSTEAASVLARR